MPAGGRNTNLRGQAGSRARLLCQSVMRAACPRGGGKPDWPAPVCGSPRKPCRAHCARPPPARADRAAAAPTPGPSLTAAGRPGGMRAGAPSCVKAGDACGDLQRATTGCTELAQACTVRLGQARATSVPRAANACAMRLCETIGGAWRRLSRGAGPFGFATATLCADAVAAQAWPRRPLARTGRRFAMRARRGVTASRPVARLKLALHQSCTQVTAVHRARQTQQAVATQKWVRREARHGCRQRGWTEVPEGLAGLDGVAAGAAEGMAPDAVPEMGLGPGWLRSQPAQPSTAMIASTAAGRARRLQVTGASLRRRAGNGCAGRYAWSYCSRSLAGRCARPALGKRRNAQYDERSARRAGGRNPSAPPAPDRASTTP
ncbi:hypothetical protein CBM2589_A90911 [Cupriavidus taiwanensis]|uniref:Uncharacterized protein n=1 Tax=Cupriavidus taiwanensis TaxID=164546 RepID=A0A976A9G2_9BURK|nr:hypothetical protein CBM2589_A90911 [Cupriavidus taiwanensis]